MRYYLLKYLVRDLRHFLLQHLVGDLRMLASGFYLGTPVVAITQYQMFSQFCIHDQNHMELRSAGHGYENQYLDTML